MLTFCNNYVSPLYIIVSHRPGEPLGGRSLHLRGCRLHHTHAGAEEEGPLLGAKSRGEDPLPNT